MKTIPSCPSYCVTSEGLIFSTLTGKFLKPRKRKNGYHQVLLRCDGKYKTVLVHRAVLEGYLGPSSLQINHKNGDKSDNRIENLEYVTREENLKHAQETGLLTKGPVSLYRNGVGYWFPSQTSAVVFTGLSQQEVSSLVLGKRNRAKQWKHNPF